VIRFRPRPQQLAVLEMLFVHGHKRIIILKARQIGFSTLLGVVCCDQLCFNPGQQISLIDQTLEDARQKVKNIVVLAYESMAAELRAALPMIRSNTGEICVKYSRLEEAKASVMYAGTDSRGGSNSLVWVSEWGTIQATDTARSEEILTGALPSVGDGICVSKAPGAADATGICGGWSSRPWKPPTSAWRQKRRALPTALSSKNTESLMLTIRSRRAQ
jgi:hypothetical protein